MSSRLQMAPARDARPRPRRLVLLTQVDTDPRNEVLAVHRWLRTGGDR